MIEIQEIFPDQLNLYAKVPISFEVKSILQVCVAQKGLGGILLEEIAVEKPYTKDYDKTPGNSPLDWASQYNITNWGFFLVFDRSLPSAAAAVAFNTNGVNLLEGREDLSVLWDIRVNHDRRGQGIGKALFNRVCIWSALRYCQQMKIETQNINSGACHFYLKMGCELGTINRFAYWQEPDIAHETMLNWYFNF